jgi:putative tricarboxylic transport membrane protein
MKLARPDFLLGLASLALSVVYLHFAAEIPESLLSDAVGAAGVPKALGWAMAVLGALLCLRSMSARTAGAEADDEADDDAEAGSGGTRPHLMALGLLVILVVYVMVTPVLGYIVSTALLIGAVARFGGTAVNRNFFIIAIAGGVGLWLMFDPMLSIPLPVGSLWGGS